MSEEQEKNLNQNTSNPDNPSVDEVAKPTVPKPEVKNPAPKPKAPAKNMNRRQFISWLGLAWTTFTAATLGALSLCARFMFPNVLFEPKSSFKAGFPENFDIGVVNDTFETKHGVWLIRNDEGIYALSTICTHLGCKPSWLDGESKFKCPCHGSGFYKTGINFEGPAPRPLERFRIALAEDGQVLVDKSKKFQQEKGQWNDPESFLSLG